MSELNIGKETAGKKAVDFIESGMVVGLGTGSTVKYTLEELSRRLKEGILEGVTCLASSVHTEQKAMQLDLPLTTFNDINKLDLTIDGADEVDEQLNLIKGGGGALLREKILAQNSQRFIVVVDESKISTNLGEKWSVPVEVLPFGWRAEANYLETMGASWQIRKTIENQVYLTDQDNYILDCQFGIMKHPGEISDILDKRAGILGNGLFINLATDVIIGTEYEWRHITAAR